MRQRVVPFVIAAAVILLDHITKSLIRGRLSMSEALTVIPGWFNIVHTENPGIAFGFLAETSGAWRDVFLIGFSVSVLIVISTILLRGDRNGTQGSLLRTALALVLGGACGNLYDRLVSGTVTDFLEVHAGQHYFPAFNVADSAISIGACLLLIDMWRTRERKTEPVDVPR